MNQLLNPENSASAPWNAVSHKQKEKSFGEKVFHEMNDPSKRLLYIVYGLFRQ